MRTPAKIEIVGEKAAGSYGIVVFSHLRWGFVWQRPQQFLSRFAKKHSVLFIEEPFFDRPEHDEPELQFHRVMPNVTVACPHLPPSWDKNPKLPDLLRKYAHEAIEAMNDNGEFDLPLIWYYSPMDASWSLGHFENRGIVYDSMDELSQFTGAPRSLIANERRLMDHSDVVFTGGYELYLKKKEQHPNVHFFGCGVEFEHFSQAGDPNTSVPPDIDFMNRPILGWFGVVDERVDYNMVGEMARMRPEWSFAMVGPVVKVDPNLLPHFPNLYWLGGRDYSVLPNYCRAFDVNMMCFAINAATQFINPTKALEYLATGKPVVSTAVKDVVTQYTGIVDIVRTAGGVRRRRRAGHADAGQGPDRQRVGARPQERVGKHGQDDAGPDPRRDRQARPAEHAEARGRCRSSTTRRTSTRRRRGRNSTPRPAYRMLSRRKPTPPAGVGSGGAAANAATSGRPQVSRNHRRCRFAPAPQPNRSQPK